MTKKATRKSAVRSIPGPLRTEDGIRKFAESCWLRECGQPTGSVSREVWGHDTMLGNLVQNLRAGQLIDHERDLADDLLEEWDAAVAQGGRRKRASLMPEVCTEFASVFKAAVTAKRKPKGEQA